jgi:MFS family permease
VRNAPTILAVNNPAHTSSMGADGQEPLLNQKQQAKRGPMATVDNPDYETYMKSISTKNMIRIAILGLVGSNFGFYMVIFNPMGKPLLKDVYGFDDDTRKQYIGNINLLYSIGGLIASFCIGPLAEKLGRRKLLHIMDYLSVMMVIMYSIQDIWVLQLTRLVGGFLGSGSYVLTSIIVTELFPKRISGIANTFLYSCFNFCVFGAYISQNILSHDILVEYWRYVLCFPLIPLTIKAVLASIAMPVESPKYLVKLHHNTPELEDHLKHAYRHTHRESEVHEITESCINVYQEQRNSLSNGSSKSGQSAGGHLKLLFSKLMLKRTCGGFLIALAHTTCGIGYFANYSTDLFDRISGNGKQVTFYYAWAKLVGCVVAVVAMKQFGRKFNFLFGLSLQGFMIFVILISDYYKIGWIGIVAIMVFSNSYSMGLGGSWMAFLSETLTPTGVSVAGAVNFIASGTMGKLLPLLAYQYGDLNVLMCFGVAALTHAMILDLFVIETKGKKEERIILEYKLKKYRPLNFN